MGPGADRGRVRKEESTVSGEYSTVSGEDRQTAQHGAGPRRSPEHRCTISSEDSQAGAWAAQSPGASDCAPADRKDRGRGGQRQRWTETGEERAESQRDSEIERWGEWGAARQ